MGRPFYGGVVSDSRLVDTHTVHPREVPLRLRLALLLGSSIGLALVAAGTKVGKFVVEAL